jgi:hypothetical protein
MVKKAFITIVIMAVAFIIVVGVILANQTPAENTVSSLKAGNVFVYDVRGYATLIDENVTIPQGILELNMTESYSVTITTVTGPEVSFNTTWRLTNGTIIDNTGKVNLLNGEDNGVFWTIFRANLTLNTLVTPEGSDGLIVNSTEDRAYKASSRATNVISLENEFVDVDDPTLSRTYYSYFDTRFDKITGMMVELRDTKVFGYPQVVLTNEWKLIDSDVWDV